MSHTPAKLPGVSFLSAFLLALVIQMLLSISVNGAQIITLPNGDQFQFVGVTYGTNHSVGGLPGIVDHLPSGIATLLTNHAGTNLTPRRQRTTGVPELLVWFKPVGTVAGASLHYRNGMLSGSGNFSPAFYTKLADENGLESGLRCEVEETDTVQSFGSFEVVPRRARNLQLNFYSRETFASPSSRAEPQLFATLKFKNPAYGRFPQWQPETNLTDSSMGPLLIHNAGDLPVAVSPNDALGITAIGPTKLVNVDVNAPGKKFYVRPKVLFGGNFGWLRDDTDWLISGGELSDATGNRVSMESYDNIRQNMWKPYAPGVRLPIASLSYPQFVGVPWPTESAWRLSLEFKRTYDFSADESVTFTNIPIPPAGSLASSSFTNFSQGVPVLLSLADVSLGMRTVMKMAPVSSTTVNSGDALQITVSLPSNPTNVALDLLYPSTDTGVLDLDTDDHYDRYLPGMHPKAELKIYRESIPAGAKFFTIPTILQKTRTAQFFIKPPVGQSTNSVSPR